VANGCTGSVVRFCEVWQQDLLAQQAGAHGFLLGAFTKTHAAETGRSDATNIATTKTSDAVTLLTISLLSSMTKTKGRAAPLNLRPVKTRNAQCSTRIGKDERDNRVKDGREPGNMINTQ